MILYKKTIGTLLSKVDDNFVVLKGREVFRVNEIGARILDLCNGENEIKNIVEKLKSIYDVDSSNLELDVAEYIDYLENLGLIKKAS